MRDLRGATAAAAAAAGGGGGAGPRNFGDDEAEVHAALTAGMERVMMSMTGFVPAQAILRKITADYGTHEVGEFRSALVGMLSGYAVECEILRTAARALEADVAASAARKVATRKRALPAAAVTLVGAGGSVYRGDEAAAMMMLVAAGGGDGGAGGGGE